MTEFLLIRHAVNDFVKTGKLAGWTPEVHLNAEGQAQATALGDRLAETHIDAIYSSPLERTVETAQAILPHHKGLQLRLLEEVGEVRYGTWQGAELGKLAQRKLWRAVQINPSRVVFPGGESMRGAQMRAVNAVEMLAERHPRQRVAVVSHSDIIKMILAHFLGLHLDLFQRIDVSPASISIVRLHFGRPSIVQINETTFLPKRKAEAQDERTIDAIRPVTGVVIDAVGEPGNRRFFLQATGAGLEMPVTLDMEKTQALMLAGQLDELRLPAASTAESPTLIPPDRVLFRMGQFTLKYPAEDNLVLLEIEEMLGEGQGTPRRLSLWLDAGQAAQLGEHARQVAQRGRSGSH